MRFYLILLCIWSSFISLGCDEQACSSDNPETGVDPTIVSENCHETSSLDSEVNGNSENSEDSEISSIQSMVTGSNHTCKVSTGGQVECWGIETWQAGGYSAERPDGYTQEDRIAHLFPPEEEFQQVALGTSHTCGLTTSGNVSCWGIGPAMGNTPYGTLKSITAGHLHTCGLTTEGRAVCWGEDNDIPIFENGELKSQYSGHLSPPQDSFVELTAGSFHTCGLKENGSVKCWGSNKTPSGDVVGQSHSPAGTFISISAGKTFTCGIEMNGRLTCWGDLSGEVPNDSFVRISAGGSHACGIRENGTILCWGTPWVSGFSDEDGGTIYSFGTPSGKFRKISSGSNHTWGELESGELVCWGEVGGVIGLSPSACDIPPVGGSFLKIPGL